MVTSVKGCPKSQNGTKFQFHKGRIGDLNVKGQRKRQGEGFTMGVIKRAENQDYLEDLGGVLLR